MPSQVSLTDLYEKVGEVGAIAREAKHAAAGASAKIDALALIVTAQGQLRDHVERLEHDRREDHAQIEVLRADKLRREGAIGLIEWLSKNYPFIIALLGLALWVGWANGVFK